MTAKQHLRKEVSSQAKKMVARLENYIQIKKWLKPMEVDFNKSFWWVFWQQRGMVATLVLATTLTGGVFNYLLPFAVAIIIREKSWNYLMIVSGVAVFISILAHILFFFDFIVRKGITRGIELSAMRFFVSVDPLAHATKSTGQILSKTKRASEGMRKILSEFSFKIITVLFGIVINVSIFFSINIWAGLLSLSSILYFIIVGFVFLNYSNQNIVPIIIEKEDRAEALKLETFIQLQYIRSLFASQAQLKRFTNLARSEDYTRAVNWRIGSWLITLQRLVFIGCICLFFYIYTLNPNISAELYLAAMVSYFTVYNDVFGLAQSADLIFESIKGVEDFWQFIRCYGKQSYPVLEGDEELNSQTN